MHCHKKNYFQGGVSESAKIKVHTIDYYSNSKEHSQEVLEFGWKVACRALLVMCITLTE